MKMQPQTESTTTNTLGQVANTQRRDIIRDRFVGLVLAVGLVIGVVSIESAAHASLVPQSAKISQPMPFGK
jgi:hypothetical protein